jgi:hypothetical protein
MRLEERDLQTEDEPKVRSPRTTSTYSSSRTFLLLRYRSPTHPCSPCALQDKRTQVIHVSRRTSHHLPPTWSIGHHTTYRPPHSSFSPSTNP